MDELVEGPLDSTPNDTLDERLTVVFEATFPDLPRDAIRTASVETVPEWDSLQSVILMTLLEEEFSIAISPLELPDLGSYDAVRGYLLRAHSSN